MGGVAGGVATAINQAKNAQKTDLEKEKLTEEIKRLKDGKGLRLSPYEGRAIYDFIKITKHTKLPFLKDMELEITHDGNGIYIKRPNHS